MDRHYSCPVCGHNIAIPNVEDSRSLFGRLVQCRNCESQLAVGTDEHGVIGLISTLSQGTQLAQS